MKKAELYNSQISNSASFKNKVCQDTFQSLPKIYGNLKYRTKSSKINLIDRIHKKSLSKLSKVINHSPQSQSSRNQHKIQTKRQQIHDNSSEGDREKHSAKKMFRKVTNYSNKYSKLPLYKKEDRKSRISRLKIDEIDINPKVKFNTLHSILPVIQSTKSKSNRPQTLSELLQQKQSKSVGSMNPLIHLYKHRTPQSSANFNIRFPIKEENEDESPKITIGDELTHKQIKLSMRYKDHQNNQSKKRTHQRIKTEPSQGSKIESKSKAMMTQFSKRLAKESRESKKKGLQGIGNMFQKESTKFHIPSKEQYNAFIQTYQLNSQAFSLKQLAKKQKFKIISDQNSVYFGLFQKMKQGAGILVTEDFIFQGYFDKDSKIKGSQITFDGIYTGKFNKQGQRQGKGKFQWNNGQVYEGEWFQGKKHGKGTWMSQQGKKYQGQWIKGRQQGTGVFQHKESLYKGEFQNSLKHGNGEQFFTNGDSYKGEYYKGKPHGSGQYEWIDGSSYKGQFKHGYRQGQGILHQSNGCIYKGFFKRDFKHGFGQQTSRKGQKSEGYYQKGQRVSTKKQ